MGMTVPFPPFSLPFPRAYLPTFFFLSTDSFDSAFFILKRGKLGFPLFKEVSADMKFGDRSDIELAGLRIGGTDKERVESPILRSYLFKGAYKCSGSPQRLSMSR